MRFNGRIVIPRESIKKKATGAAADGADDADDAANEKSIIDLYVREVLMRDVTPLTRWDSLDKRCLCVFSATDSFVSGPVNLLQTTRHYYNIFTTPRDFPSPA